MEGYYIGLMTGSSTDAADAALVDFSGDMPNVLCAHSQPFPDSIRTSVIDAQHGTAIPPTEISRLHAAIGRELAAAAEGLIRQAKVPLQRIRAIGSHGQTICHLPNESPGSTMQLGDPAQIVERTGITTVADFRSRDMAAGGQGAPFACALHAAYLRSGKEDRCVLNLGGIANLTVLPRDESAAVIGFDSGPANALMDVWIEKHSDYRFDKGGKTAATGSTDYTLLERYLNDPYFQIPPPKSTGRDYFSAQWLANEQLDKLSLPDALATLTELTAASVADAIREHAPHTATLLVCGGGVLNDYLMGRLDARLPNTAVCSTAREGIDPQWMETILIAWLAARTVNGLTGNLPSVTGASGERICGAIYPA